MYGVRSQFAFSFPACFIIYSMYIVHSITLLHSVHVSGIEKNTSVLKLCSVHNIVYVIVIRSGALTVWEFISPSLRVCDKPYSQRCYGITFL